MHSIIVAAARYEWLVCPSSLAKHGSVLSAGEKEVEIVWPPTVLLHNIPRSKNHHGRYEVDGGRPQQASHQEQVPIKQLGQLKPAETTYLKDRLAFTCH